ncbi:Rhodopirellula transposase (plasmid) [Streptomyces sp. YIM 121038]|nr:Rhodopirellula transposase [Streptomyces sp. YIM 121038]
MFCHITANWRGQPLTSYQVVIETITATTTGAGLTIGAELDTGSYPLGATVTSPNSTPCRSRPTPSTASGTTPWPATARSIPKSHRPANRSIRP